MNKYSRLALYFALAIVMLISSAIAVNADTLTSGNWEYEITDGQVGITKYLGNEENVVVPATIAGKSVIGVGQYAFYEKDKIKTITVSEGIKYFGGIYMCENLQKLNLPSTATLGLDWGTDLFSMGGLIERCNNLEEINVASGNKYLKIVDGVLFSKDGKVLMAYPKAKKDSEYYVPDGVEVLASEAFSYTLGLRSVVFSDTVKRVGIACFEGCNNLRYVDLAHCEILGQFVFRLSSIEKLYLPAELESFSPGALSGMDCLDEIIVDDDNEALRIVDGMLCKGTKLLVYVGERPDVNLFIPEGIEEIDMGAFNECDNARNFYFPESVKKFSSNVFHCNKGGAHFHFYFEGDLPDPRYSSSISVLNYTYVHKHPGKEDWTSEKKATFEKMCDDLIEWSSDEHFYKLDSVTTEPTSTDEGLGTYKCIVCGDEKTDSIPKNTATVPTVIDESAIELEVQNIEYTGDAATPTITVKDKDNNELVLNQDYFVSYRNNNSVGTATAIITGCGKYTGRITVPFTIYCLHHDKTLFEHNDPTCLDPGNEQYWYCPTCKKVFQDEECTVPMSDEAWVLPATGHLYVKKNAGNKYTYNLCQYCGKLDNLTGPSFAKKVKVTAGKKKITVKWKKQSKANRKKFNGYMIRYSTSSKFTSYKTVYASKNSSSKTISKLKSKKKYYIRVYTYAKKSQGKFISKPVKKSIKTK